MQLLKTKLALMLGLTLVSCASPPPVVYKPIQLPPLAEEIQPLQANLSERLSKLLSPSQQKETAPSQVSTPVLPNITK